MTRGGSLMDCGVGERATAPGEWSYGEAFCRHRGLLSAREQERLRESCVGIVGMGCVGGVHLVTLVRLGVGRFHIADPDRFELANMNRQYGASAETLGLPKTEVMAEVARGINPEVELGVFSEGVTADNVGAFLDGVDVVVDGIDFFAIEGRRLLFREARRRGMWAVTAGPVGFSTAWLVFDPAGMSFDDYFALDDSMDRLDQLVAFGVGLAPRATQRAYLELAAVDLGSGTGPSAGLACHLASGVAAAEVMKIVLGRGPVYAAPWYFQFDAYRQVFRRGRLLMGNRHPLQRVKRWWLRRLIESQDVKKQSRV